MRLIKLETFSGMKLRSTMDKQKLPIGKVALLF